MLNNFVTCQIPKQQQPTRPPIPNNDTDDGLKKRQCFAIMNKLKFQFNCNGISENAFWCWALKSQGKDANGSRAQLEVVDWTILAARLHAAQQNTALFDVLCQGIKKEAHCQVYRINPDASEKRIFTGIFEKSVFQRCQTHANATQCVVRCHAYGQIENFKPQTNEVHS